MSNLTNKDGIPIRVGQVWLNSPTCVKRCEFTVDDIGERHVWCVMNEQYLPTLPEAQNFFHHLIIDPVWGDMSEWRIVTDKDDVMRIIKRRPKEAEAWRDDRWQSIDDCWFGNATPLRLPRDFEWPVEDAPKAGTPKPRKIEHIKKFYHGQYSPWFYAIQEQINILTDAINELRGAE